jgi:hypothetical protein
MLRLILCILCVYGSVTGIGKCQDISGFSKKVVVSVPWGSKPGEIGKIPNIIGKTPGGPASFDVDINNNIYILDAGNKRVLIFNDNGELNNYFPLDDGYNYISSLIEYAEDENAVYIQDYRNKMFSVYKINGEFLQRIRYSKSIGNVYSIKNGKIIGNAGYIEIKDIDREYNLAVQEVLIDIEMQNRLINEGKYTGILYYHDSGKYENGVDRYIIYKRDNTRNILEIEEVPLDYITIFLFETTDGEPVFFASPNDGKRPYIILKYNINLQLKSKVEEFDITNSRGYFVERPFAYSEIGDYYTLKLNDAGAFITRYIF